MFVFKIADNGKSISEVRAKLEKMFNLDDTKPMCFHRANLMKKSECGTHSAGRNAETFNLAINPPFANTMLAEVMVLVMLLYFQFLHYLYLYILSFEYFLIYYLGLDYRKNHLIFYLS